MNEHAPEIRALVQEEVLSIIPALKAAIRADLEGERIDQELAETASEASVLPPTPGTIGPALQRWLDAFAPAIAENPDGTLAALAYKFDSVYGVLGLEEAITTTDH